MHVCMPDKFKPTMLAKRSLCAELLLAQMSDLGYVIERGMESINLPLESDIDLLLSERDRASFIQRVIASGMLLYASMDMEGCGCLLERRGPTSRESIVRGIFITEGSHY